MLGFEVRAEHARGGARDFPEPSVVRGGRGVAGPESAAVIRAGADRPEGRGERALRLTLDRHLPERVPIRCQSKNQKFAVHEPPLGPRKSKCLTRVKRAFAL